MIKKYFIFSLIIILLALSGCMNQNKESVNDRWQEKVFYHYNVKIQTNGSNNYTIWLPIPIKSYHNPEPTKLTNEIMLIEGDAEFQIINTEVGYALQLNSSGNFEIEAHKEFENPSREIESKYIFWELSMSTGDRYNSPKMIFLYLFSLMATPIA